MNIYEKALGLLNENQAFSMAEIVRQRGSTPRGKGARMLVLADGRIMDTIGGGGMENQAALQAVRLIKEGRGDLYSFDMSGGDVVRSPMICGGQGTVLITPFTSQDAEVLEKTCRAVAERRQCCWLVTLLEDGEFRHAFVDEEKNLTCGQNLTSRQEKLILDAVGSSMHSQREEGLEICVRPLVPNGRLLIFGAGHVGLETAELCRRIGFEVTVVDDRREFLGQERFPGMATVAALKPEELPAELAPDGDTWILIVTRGHILDRQWLKWALEAETEPAYVGMIGSRRKREMVYGQLLAEGISQEKIDKVRSPVGLPIGAETPVEIAVCIAAEIIQLRSQRRGGEKQRVCPV
ncbi:MAG: XdhC family protein [Peptococcaceae bacterium]|nr:XdhC family protein [Peptococcaceae bacterium]